MQLRLKWIQQVLWASLLIVANIAFALPPSQANTAQPMMEMPLVIPLFIENSQFSSTLILVNAANAIAPVTIEARDIAGNRIANKAITLAANSQYKIEMRSLLDSADSPEIIGSLLIGTPQANPVVGSLAITYQGEGQPSFVDEEVAMPSMAASPTLRAVTSEVNEDPIVSVTSLASSAQQITLTCLGHNGMLSSQQFSLSGGATRVFRVCGNSSADSQNTNPLFLVAAGDGSGTQQTETYGISLTTNAMPGSFAAFALAPFTAGGTRHIRSVPFTDPKSTGSSTAVYVGVPIGDAPQLSSGRYTPRLSVGNFSAATAHVKVMLSSDLNSSTTPAIVRQITLLPNQSDTIGIEGLEGDQISNSFQIASDTQPGDLMTKFISTGPGGENTVELLGMDLAKIQNGGAHPWNVEDGVTSTLILFNPGSEEVPFEVLVANGGTLWEKRYKVTPTATQTIDLGSLISTQAKDDYGRTLSKGLTSGMVSWTTGIARGFGRLLQSNLYSGLARNFSCEDTYYVCGREVSSENTTVGQLGYVTLQPTSCVSTNHVACGQSPSSYQGSNYQYYWDVAPTSIIEESYAENDSVFVQGVSGGTGTVSGQVMDSYGCSAYGAAQVTVGPTITSISPSTIMIGASNVQLTISGSGFGSSPHVNLPSGVTVKSQTAVDTQITLTVNAAYSATIGNNNVSVVADGITSNSITFIVDGPAYMTVNSDNWGLCSGCTSTIQRTVAYKVHNFSGATTNLANQAIGEVPSVSNSCTTPVLNASSFTTCSSGDTTDGGGNFADRWSMNTDSVSPSGCKGTVISDHWQMCFNGNPITFGTLSGYVAATTIDINGYVVPPTANEMPVGLRVNP